jgi:hypothetical protein
MANKKDLIASATSASASYRQGLPWPCYKQYHNRWIKDWIQHGKMMEPVILPIRIVVVSILPPVLTH